MSEVKVNKISPRTNCGTVTLGDSGDSFVIPAGATITNNGTASGFGSTGEISWSTTVKTGDFTGTAGIGYFINTTSGAITVTLPSASAGDSIAVQDYNNTFDSNACTVQAPSGVKINGGTAAGSIELSTEGQGLTLVYVDSTVGWRSVDSTTFTESSIVPTHITATGGTITTVCTDYKVHTFTGPGTFQVTGGSGPLAVVDYMVVAGGGGGGSWVAGGGGSGGYRFSNGTVSGCYTAGPAPLGASALPVAVQSYGITVGAGGTAASYPAPGPGTDGGSGGVSTFSTITSAGGGGGGGYCSPAPTPTQARAGVNGGSGGGAGATNAQPGSAGSGNIPSVSPPQGNNGGANTGAYFSGGGGGGAGAVGTSVGGGTSDGGVGGAGLTSCITASPVTRGGGGGGSSQNGSSASGGSGGGGGGAGNGGPASVAGTVNTGGGGGGGRDSNGAAGGSGIVIIRYKFQ